MLALAAGGSRRRYVLPRCCCVPVVQYCCARLVLPNLNGAVTKNQLLNTHSFARPLEPIAMSISRADKVKKLTQLFQKAVNFVQKSKDAKLSNDVKLKFYGLFKQVLPPAFLLI